MCYDLQLGPYRAVANSYAGRTDGFGTEITVDQDQRGADICSVLLILNPGYACPE